MQNMTLEDLGLIRICNPLSKERTSIMDFPLSRFVGNDLQGSVVLRFMWRIGGCMKVHNDTYGYESV